jgi:N-acyl-D-aspartate/D-glutamate deacylase
LESSATKSRRSATSTTPAPRRSSAPDGLAVAPGFVNLMSGDDSLRVDGRSMSDIRQGVTTEIFGEGDSMGPLTQEMRARRLANQGDLKYPITWSTLHEGMVDLEKARRFGQFQLVHRRVDAA